MIGVGDTYKILLRLTFAGIAEINPFVRIWLDVVAPPVQQHPPNVKPAKE